MSGADRGDHAVVLMLTGTDHWPLTTTLGAGVTPAGNLRQPFGAGLPKQAHTVAGVLEFVDISPNFCLPGLVMDSGFTAGGASGMQSAHSVRVSKAYRQLDENAADLLYVLVLADEMFVAKQVAKAEFAGLALGL